MKNRFALVMSLLVSLFSVSVYAAEKDAADCKDHPLVPRLPGYFIVACAANDASFDMEPPPGQDSGTVHVEGKSRAIAYSGTAELKPKPDREKVLSNFENAVKKYDATLIGMTNSTPVYRLMNDGKEIWVAVLTQAVSVSGGYAYRIMEKGDLVLTKKEESMDDKLGCDQYGPPMFAPIAGYLRCGCGGSDSSNREVKIESGKRPGTVRIQGKLTEMAYCPGRENKSPDQARVRRQFESDIRKLGGTLVGRSKKNPGIEIYKLTQGGKVTWIEVWTEESGNYSYVVTR
jgi:hypothetical protein